MNLSDVIDFGTLFANATVAGVPLLLFVLALVQWVKASFDLSGRVVRFVAMGVGLVLGVGYQASSAAIQPTFSSIFTVLVFGLLLGLAASQLYDTGANVVTTALKRQASAAKAVKG